ncbi:MAG: lytic transglycosylase domain-containing protein [Actinomycetota bacterium]
MSVVEALARIQQIEAALAPPAAAPAATDTGFATALAGAGGAREMSLPATVAAGTSTGATGGTAVPADVAPLIRAAAAEAGVDPTLVAAVARAESNFRPDAVSPAGAQGIMQLMPGTARGLGVTDPFDAWQSLRGGARYLRQQLDRFGGDTTLALAAYNAGPGAVARSGGVPPYAETQAYVRRVLSYQRDLAATGV